MLEHDNLEEFADPRRYDLEDDSDTGVAFYAALARAVGGPVLEIACGTGRVAIPIARLGFPVTGVDIVPGMLERARAKSAGLPQALERGLPGCKPRPFRGALPARAKTAAAGEDSLER